MPGFAEEPGGIHASVMSQGWARALSNGILYSTCCVVHALGLGVYMTCGEVRQVAFDGGGVEEVDKEQQGYYPV